MHGNSEPAAVTRTVFTALLLCLAVAGNQLAVALEAVRAKVVAVIDESALSPDRLAILQSEFARA